MVARSKGRRVSARAKVPPPSAKNSIKPVTRSSKVAKVTKRASLDSTPKKAAAKPSPPSPQKAPLVKKVIEKSKTSKKVNFAPETVFVAPPSSQKSSPIAVGAEALLAVGAALTAWFYPLFTGVVGSSR